LSVLPRKSVLALLSRCSCPILEMSQDCDISGRFIEKLSNGCDISARITLYNDVKRKEGYYEEEDRGNRFGMCTYTGAFYYCFCGISKFFGNPTSSSGRHRG